MTTKEIPDEIPEEVPPTNETIKGTKNKNGTPRKTLSEEDQKKRLEILAKGRLVAQEKRRKMRDEAKADTPKPVAKPIPEPPITENNVSEPETVKVKKKKKKIIVMESSDSSSSEEEVIVKKKKKKKKPSPSPPPAPAAPSPAPQPQQPRYTQEELDNLRKEKIKQIKAKEKADKVYNSLFN
jgi:hypothetical protein